jgi:hypothetical protein
MDAEDFRDHMPCPGSELDQMRDRAEKAERTIMSFQLWLDEIANPNASIDVVRLAWEAQQER